MLNSVLYTEKNDVEHTGVWVYVCLHVLMVRAALRKEASERAHQDRKRTRHITHDTLCSRLPLIVSSHTEIASGQYKDLSAQGAVLKNLFKHSMC